MKILVVDDERDVVEALSLAFGVQWPDCKLVTAYSGEEALRHFYEEAPDVVILDIVMPEMTGYDVLRHIRKVSQVPIIMLTVKDEEMDKVRALELGADDYVTKPFGLMELIARIRAVLRRSEASLVGAGAPQFHRGDLTVDFNRHEATVAGRRAKLTPRESKLLEQLVRAEGRTIPHRALLACAWGGEYSEKLDSLKVYIGRLRRKLEADPQNPRLILTDKNVGYRFAGEETAIITSSHFWHGKRVGAALNGKSRLTEEARAIRESDPPTAARPPAKEESYERP
ncbi:MAG: response regulator transcription factor [Chloroflexota bacterium]|nr:response regulator transcription factor [Chloroflexota bacterium]